MVIERIMFFKVPNKIKTVTSIICINSLFTQAYVQYTYSIKIKEKVKEILIQK